MGKGQDKDHSKGDFEWVYGKKKVQKYNNEALKQVARETGISILGDVRIMTGHGPK